jgi:hypothetical protein
LRGQAECNHHSSLSEQRFFAGEAEFPVKLVLNKTLLHYFLGEDGLFLGPHLPPAKPSAAHAVMNSNNPKTQQNTPKVHTKAR